MISILGRCAALTGIMLFKYPSASLRRRGRATFPRAHCSYRGRSARTSSHLEGEIKVEEPATIAVEYRIGSRCALPIKHYGNLSKARAEREGGQPTIRSSESVSGGG